LSGFAFAFNFFIFYGSTVIIRFLVMGTWRILMCYHLKGKANRFDLF